ncbi:MULTISPECIES: pyruvate kinase [Brevibacillus]|uniref:Pyruvate kinase n=3 Tax=Brevibacillus borstelensis TaxID=45462 RepID=M8DHW6_9BACL|nr:pyruvate kinase [Brevibacillus borstelensis]EMT53118.1 pyruvate kinase [Brevibacillus borstelensis AK1]KKX55492.1 pyruvate kinase [Brevibacillus borstelensis cifa_chp40]MBE5397542.1 pyruvate kinase [Brevibacillus borstelensis]MCC0564952.1 pyruvate kinase [Brevibacillus borstelensis]MCM3469182.1 pyruvate kinase [Brevibacillus borstelensis]
MLRKAKIVCTIGPASESVETLKKLIHAGMNVARLNFSHGSHEEHAARIVNIRRACEETGKQVAILLDTKGPEIRTGTLGVDSVELVEGNRMILTTEEVAGTAERVSITYAELPRDVKAGDTILIDDGLIGLFVEKVEGNEIVCEIKNGGTLKSKKGVNVPGVKINLPGITEKDAQDIVFGIEQGVDFIAASFVRKASDILEIREILERHHAKIDIIAKIENQEGVDNVDEILAVADGLMVARGDLGVEIPAEEVPLVQKQLIKKCNDLGKPVITATQMLDSMQRNPRPTRAEASDVANAIFDGTDAIMLSGETAAGKYPVESVETMNRIAVRAEQELNYREILFAHAVQKQVTITDAISQAVSNAALDLDAAAVITATESGHTARMVSKYRPKAPIVAVTPHESVMRRLALVNGVYPVLGTVANTTDEMLELSVQKSLEAGFVRHGDLVVITAGVPVREVGTTNLMKIHVIGDIVAKGQGIGRKIVSGKVVVARSAAEALEKTEAGSVLVMIGTDSDMVPAFEKAGAVITEEGGLTSHAAIVGLNLNVPVIVGVKKVTDLLKDGQTVTVDAERGHIYTGHARVL